MENAQVKKPDQEQSAASSLVSGVLGLVFLCLPVIFIWAITPNWIRYPAFYAAIYQIKLGSVVVDKKPPDCDWGHSPIGDKACHYRKEVYTARGQSGRVTYVHVEWGRVQD